jgi:hypothetical protein
VEYFRVAFFGSPQFSALMLTLISISVGIPLLLIRLYRGKAASSFFAKTVAG